MKTAIIGYTGFVGSNIAQNMKFDDYYNSKNILDIKDKEYDLLVCSGIRAEKYLANKYPERDLEEIKAFLKNLESLKRVGKIVFISTIDVYKNPIDVTEDTEIDENGLQPYGKNRFFAEKYIQDNFYDYLIIRLPGLFGKNLKKNFLYDMITKIPTMVVKEKYLSILNKLENKEKDIFINSYDRNIDNNYVYNNKNRIELISILEKIGFTSINFTDSRSFFQFYNLNKLSKDIKVALEKKIKKLNISSEPISAKVIAKEVFGYEMKNIIKEKLPLNYNFKSKYFELFDGKNGYLYSKEEIIEDIKNFVKKMEK